MLKVNEIFKGIQGEGKSAGEQRLFVRLSGCTLDCSFCDTSYHRESRELNQRDNDKLNDNLFWCLTGGEPLIQQTDLLELINKYQPFFVEIETNGTIIPAPELTAVVDRWNISPKERRFQKKQ